MNQEHLFEQILKMGDQEKRVTDKQAKILHAAIEIFAKKGFASTTTSEIAKKAGVAEGTIFRHYKTKKELLYSIISPFATELILPFFADRFVKEVFEAPTNQSYEELLKQLIRNRFEFVQSNVDLVKIIIQEMAFQEEIQHFFQQTFVEKVYPKFSNFIKEFQRRGEISADFPINTVLRLTIASVVGFLFTRFVVLPDANWKDEEEIEHTIAFIRKGLA